MRILNLDEIVSEDKEVTIGKKKYIIPGDLPVDVMLKLIDNSGKLQENSMDVKALQDGVDLLIGIFQLENNADISEIRKHLTMNRYMKLMSFVFGGVEDDGKKSDTPSETDKNI